MYRRIGLSVLLPSLLLACAGNQGAGEDSLGRDRSLLTHEELNNTAFNDAYHAVEVLRSQWLRPRGVNSPNRSGQVWVFMNNSRLGGVDVLRGMTTQDITFIRFYDPVSAAGRWGRDVGHGVIFVSTERP